MTYYRQFSTDRDAPQDYLSSDTKFIITIVLGVVVIFAVVVLIPRVSLVLGREFWHGGFKTVLFYGVFTPETN